MTGEQKGVELRQEIMDTVSNYPKGIILWGTQSIWSEGVSLNELSAVILATPLNNEPLLEQICGRVMREAEGKPNPVVIDLGFEGNTGGKYWKTPQEYQKKGLHK
jgi:superfamily II DNA or RNA helicase